MTRLPQLKTPRRSRPDITAFWPVLLVVVIAAIGVVSYGSQFAGAALDQPLGPTLPPYARTPVMIPTFISGQGSPTTPTPEGASAAIVAPPQGFPTPIGTPQCDGPTQMILLVVGTDQDGGYIRGLADAIRVVRVDFTAPSISVLALPRDLWVLAPGLENRPSVENYFGHVPDAAIETMNPGAAFSKLNSTYFYGNLYDMPGGGAGLLAHTIYVNFGIPADHYVVVNMHVFEDAIDAIGGIDIDVPEPLVDEEKGWYFDAGPQHMDGETALQYARIRHPDSDFGRVERQTQIMMAVYDRILRPEVYPNLAPVINQFLDDTLTDLSRAEITSLTCIVARVPPENIRMYAIERDMVNSTRTTEGAAVLVPNPILVANLVYEFLYGPTY